MASTVWVLVEWMEEINMFPSYGVVDADMLAYNVSYLQLGEETYIRKMYHDTPRRAKILRISENKQYLQHQIEILELEDRRYRRDGEFNSTHLQLPCGSQYNPQQGSNPVVSPHVLTGNSPENASGCHTEPGVSRQVQHAVLQNFNTSFPKYGNNAPKIEPVCGTLHTAQTSRSSNQVAKTIPPLRKVQKMEAEVRGLYRKFQILVAVVQQQYLKTLKESEQDIDSSDTEHDNAENHIDDADNSGLVQNAEAEQVAEENDGDHSSKTSFGQKYDRTNHYDLKVKRMSAGTSNNIATSSKDADLVPIGDGNAKVPATVLNKINWNSHTMATRKLLKAVFPRRVLASHLPFKQPPVFVNQPPTKILDHKLVKDIVKTVSTRCRVSENLVRANIKMDCTDEAIIHLNHLDKKMKRLKNSNSENRPPSYIIVDVWTWRYSAAISRMLFQKTPIVIHEDTDV